MSATAWKRWGLVLAGIVAVTALVYVFGRPDAYTPFLVLGLGLVSFAAFYFRANPNVTFWKVVYIMGFSCWVELAWIAAQVALIAETPVGAYILAIPVWPRLAFSFLPGYVGGAFLGYWIGKRRGYAPPMISWAM